MRISKMLLAVTGIVALSLSLATLTPLYATEHGLDRLSEDGFKAAHTIAMARVAIFDGQTEEAVKLVDQTKSSLEAAAKDADKLVIKSSNTTVGPMLPIEVRLSMADDFIVTPEKKAQIQKVNEHLQKGEPKKALEVLIPEDIHLTLTTVFLPLDVATKAVNEASKLLKEGNYYQANLVLKKVEDGAIVDSQSFVDYLAALPHDKKVEKPDKVEKSAAEKPETVPKAGQ